VRSTEFVFLLYRKSLIELSSKYVRVKGDKGIYDIRMYLLNKMTMDCQQNSGRGLVQSSRESLCICSCIYS